MIGRTNFKNILIVDDSRTSRLIIKKAFVKAGFQESQYYEADDGLSAFELIENVKMNLIVTDIRMPNMDGEEFIKTLRKHPNRHDVPVIIVSSSSNVALSENLRHENILGFTQKPVTPEKIINTIESIFDLNNLEKRLFQAINESFSELYGLNVSPASVMDENDYIPRLKVVVEFLKPVKGFLAMIFSTDVVDKIGIPPDDIEDSLKEVLNVICGNFLVDYFGADHKIEILLPEISTSIHNLKEVGIIHEFELIADGASLTVMMSMEGIDSLLDNDYSEEVF